MYIWRNNEARSCNHCFSGKAVSVTYSECVFVPSLTYPACNAHAPYFHLWTDPLYNIFYTLPYKRHDFRKKKELLNTKCVF